VPHLYKVVHRPVRSKRRCDVIKGSCSVVVFNLANRLLIISAYGCRRAIFLLNEMSKFSRFEVCVILETVGTSRTLSTFLFEYTYLVDLFDPLAY